MKFWYVPMFSGLILSVFLFEVKCSFIPFQYGLIKENDEKNALDFLKSNQFNHKNSSMYLLKKEIFLNEPIKNETININQILISTQGINPISKIESISTNILIKKDKTDGHVSEKIKFNLIEGVFSSLTRKISLLGTSEKNFGFRLSSTDVKLKSAKVVHDCLEPTQRYEQPYLCVTAFFEPIDATQFPISVEIDYEYTSQNILRKREKPFTSKEEENVIIWIYDNYKLNTDIKNVDLEIRFENKIDRLSIKAYPEKYLIVLLKF